MPSRPPVGPSAARDVAAAAVALVVVALVGGGWWLGWHVGNAHNGLLGVTFTAVGLYVLRMRPRHREGWLLAGVGVISAVMFFGRQYGLHPGPLPAQDWVGWVGVWPVPLAIAVSGWAVMAFPDGRLLSPRWRAAVVAMCAAAAVMAAISALWPVEYDRTGLVAPHPMSLPGAATAATIWERLAVLYPAFQVLWTVEVVVRIRRARGDETRQLRWLVYAVVVASALLILGLVLADTPVPGLLALPLIGIAAGVAILKYRLYDIDPVINKTLVVGALLLVITAGYVGIVVGVGALLPVSGGVLTLVTTAVVAVVFEPVRRRAQRLADRVVYGRRVTPYEALAEVSAHASAAPPAGLLDIIAATVGKAVGATEVLVWVGSESSLEPLASWPGPVPPRPSTSLAELADAGDMWPVTYQERVRGAISVRKPAGEALKAAEDRLLTDLAAQTGLVLVHEAQRTELQAVARRVVTAGDGARRRIERDLHDGAQQQLVTLGLELGRLAQRAESAGDDELADGVEAARLRLLVATAELREMARGLHPSVLTQDGMEAALRALADRAAVPVELRVDPGLRLPAEVEATAYFLVSEALTNTARHAGAGRAVVEVTGLVDAVRVEVRDDGRGGARAAEGGGLQGLRDRLTALGAALEIDSPPGGGTRIAAVLRCA